MLRNRLVTVPMGRRGLSAIVGRKAAFSTGPSAGGLGAFAARLSKQASAFSAGPVTAASWLSASSAAAMWSCGTSQQGLVLPTPTLTTQRASYFTRSSAILARNRPTGNAATHYQDGSVQANNTPYYEGGSSSDGGSTAEALSPSVRQHLFKVYNLLALGVGLAAVGSSLMLFTPLGKMIPYWLPMVAGFVPLLWLSFRPPANPQLRLALFLSFTLIEGMALAPIVKMSAVAGVLGTALVLTGAVFGGFSAAAYLAPRASMLALQGPLYGMLIGMVAISVLNMFWPTAFAHSIILYGGLALFSVFVAVDTQAMIERARCGVSDPAQDAMQLFMNVVNIFVRIAQILRSMSE